MSWSECKRIGDYLLQMGGLTEEALTEGLAIQSQQEERQRIGRILLDRGWITESDLAQALSQQQGCAYLDRVPPVDETIRPTEKLPIAFLKKHQILPFVTEGAWNVALADPLDLMAIDAVSNAFGGEVKKWVCTPGIIEAGLSLYYFQEGGSAFEEGQSEGQGSVSVTLMDQGRDTEDLLESSDSAPVIHLVRKLFFQAIQARASDIHIEPYEQEVKVRYRIDGVLHTQKILPKHLFSALAARLKIMAKLKIDEQRLPQDGRSRVKVAEREIDIRVSTVPTGGGERIVLRLLDEAGADFSLEQLGFEADTKEQFHSLIHRPHGIILITGPTGSGKTTTLYGALTELNSDQRNILTVEDPIEYRLDGVGQMQIKPKIGLTFASCLRSILRQDPDVIMVGEIRDIETARIAIQSALTGHLVLSTLHTNDAASAITRLIDMGVEPYLTCSSVSAIMAQRLVRRVCPQCEGRIELSESQETCAYCSGTGFHGRVGIFELMTMNDEIREQVLNHSRSQQLKQAAVAQGMRTLRDDGLRKVERGLTTESEVMRVTQEDEEV